MVRRVASVLVSVVVGLSGMALTSPAAQAGAGSHTSTQQSREVKRITRAYGAAPFGLPRKADLRLRFDGKRGDRVALAFVNRHEIEGESRYVPRPGDEDLTLRGPSGRSVRPAADGYYRLRESGTHVLRYLRGHDRRAVRLQLMVQERVVHDGDRVQRLRQREGYQYAVRLTVPDIGLAVTTFANGIDYLVTGGKRTLPTGTSLLLRSGDGAVAGGGQRASRRLPAGARVRALLDPLSSSRVETTVPAELPATVDGVDAPLAASTPTAVSFTGAAGQLVRLHTAGSTFRWSTVLIGPDGDRVLPTSVGRAVSTSSSFELYALPADGRYLVVLMPWAGEPLADAFAIDSVVQAPPIAADSTTRTLTAPSDGRWVVAPITGTGVMHLEGSDATLAGSWRVFAGIFGLPDCRNSGNGCGEFLTSYISAAQLRGSFITSGGHVVLVPEDGRSTGSVDLRLVPSM